MKRGIPLGISDFQELMKGNYLFVDTTPFIRDILWEGSKVILITRPRRFGKTLNLSMLNSFFDNLQKSSNLFEKTEIDKDKIMMKEINQHPTIFITFKNCKSKEWGNTYYLIQDAIIQQYQRHAYLLQSKSIGLQDREYFQSILEKYAEPAAYMLSLEKLTKFLHHHYQKQVVIHIDEYDAPILNGWTYGYYDEVIDFMHVFLTAALKDNLYLFKGILTGVYRVAKESIFSALNNLAVFTLLEPIYSQYFGFTPEATEWAIGEIYNQEGRREEEIRKAKEDIKNWYDGYCFGGRTMYNPWSVMSYLRYRQAKPWWINTSSNDLIIHQINQSLEEDIYFRDKIETMMSGKSVEEEIDDSTALREMESYPDAIWALFLMSGYLTAIPGSEGQGDRLFHLSIPNQEVMDFFRRTVKIWIQQGSRNSLKVMAKALLEDTMDNFLEQLKNYTITTLRYFDISRETTEHTYHMLMLGILSQLQDPFHIRSNREAGLGRYHIMLKPKNTGQTAIIIEIKKGLDQLDTAITQIHEKGYAYELKEEGFLKIVAMAIGVEGKEIEIQKETLL